MAFQARACAETGRLGDSGIQSPHRSGDRGPLQAGRRQEAGDAGSGEDGEGKAIEFESVIDLALARFDVSLAGWSKLANYALDSWAELLGPAAFLTWMAIRHADIRRSKTKWTPAMISGVEPRAQRATRHVNRIVALASPKKRRAFSRCLAGQEPDHCPLPLRSVACPGPHK